MESYLNSLNNDLIDLLKDLSLQLTRNMWFMQDSAPPHFPLTVRDHLNETFPHCWIGRGSQFQWSLRSTKFNPLDFHGINGLC